MSQRSANSLITLKMAGPPKTKVSKRKLDNTVLVKNPKASKQDHNTSELEALKLELNLMKDKYEALVIANKEKIKKIGVLQKKINELEVNTPIEKSGKEKSSQTSTSDKIMFPCKICIFTATCEGELKWHLEEEHGFSGLYEIYNISCKHCDRQCSSEHELKTHIKSCHPDKISVCNFFLSGNCMYDDNICWYSHNIKESDRNSFQKIFRCNFCEKTFERKGDFMRHRKSDHLEKVAICTNEKNYSCTFDPDKCWYRHQNAKNNEDEKLETKDMLERLFNLMEEFTERMTMIENQL